MPYKDKEKARLNKQAYRKANKEKIQAWFDANKEKRKEYMKNYNSNKPIDKTVVSEYNKKYNELNKEKIAEKKKLYYINNKDKLIKQIYANKKERLKNDPLFKLGENIRSLITQSFKLKGVKKNTKTEQILGCSFDEFKQYLESQFESWMTWDNHGLYKRDTYNYGWDIDHIIPSSSGLNEQEIMALNHYTNLKPLCSKVNRDVKKAKLIA